MRLGPLCGMPPSIRPGTASAGATKELVEAALRGELTEGQARRLYRLGPEAVTLALLAASKRIAKQDAMIATLQGRRETQPPSPATPSGMVPIHTKPNTPKRRKKPGARQGHPGHRRERAERIDDHQTHRLERYPCCGGTLQRCERKRSRIIEDIPEKIEPVVHAPARSLISPFRRGGPSPIPPLFLQIRSESKRATLCARSMTVAVLIGPPDRSACARSAPGVISTASVNERSRWAQPRTSALTPG